VYVGQNLTDLAREIAIKAHGLQKYGAEPYVVHLEQVQEIIKRFGYQSDQTIVIAGWLHDTVEDTSLTLSEIESMFGDEIKDVVYRVTDEPGKNRKERKEKTYNKINGHYKATIVKLCDRIANVEASLSVPDKLSMYKKEFPEFYNRVFSGGMADKLWEYLQQIIMT
jgi:(p)ppGpp synthase/HD superfamily hydrolase